MSDVSAAPAARPRLFPSLSGTDRKLAIWIAAIALVGVAVAGYLVYVHYAGIEPICAASGGCERVQSSSYAKLAGIPVAAIGLGGYSAILAATLLRSEAARLVASWLALVGFGFSLYLTYLELFEINAICQWCVASAVLMAALAGLTTVRAVGGDAEAGYPSSAAKASTRRATSSRTSRTEDRSSPLGSSSSQSR